MLDSNEGIKTVDRDHHAMYKRRGQNRNNFKSATDDEDIESAPSLKASSNPPLPDLYKDKRKAVVKPFGLLETKSGTSSFVQKQVRQHDNILLKQKNNLLSSENQKLKTKIAVLEKENQRLQKSIGNENSQMKPITHYNSYKQKIKSNDSSIRNIIRGLRKQIEDLKKQNTNIKSAVKFTSLKELETERDHLAEQTIRLRLALEQQHNKKAFLKANVHGVSALEHKLQFYADKNTQLTKQLRQAQQKCKRIEQSTSKTQRLVDNDRKNSKALQSALHQIKQLQSEIQNLKSQLKTSHSIPSSTLIQNQPTTKQNKIDIKRQSLERKSRTIQGVKPAITPKVNTLTQCQKCTKLQKQNANLLEKIKKLQGDLEKVAVGSLEQLPRGPITQIKQGEVEELIRFMTLRFKAHRLTYDQSEKYLINCEGTMSQEEMNKLISVRQLMESLFVEPFCIISNRYIEILMAKLFYQTSEFPITIDEKDQHKKGEVIEAYKKIMPVYEIQNQEREEEMFIQVAELITTYYQQILAALTAKRNGEGTISEEHFLQFFKQIQLEQEYTDFIITQIILQSLDMNHLNFFAMFQIFYMPQMNSNGGTGTTNKKKKFEVQHQQIVQQEDEEYEDSKSHMGSRKKTVEHKEKQENEQDEYQWEQSKEKIPQKSPVIPTKNTALEKPSLDEQIYEEEFDDKQAVVEELIN